MGFINFKLFLQHVNVESAALCNLNQNVLENRAKEVESIQKKKPELVNDFRKLLEKKHIDVVVNANPDYWH